MNPADANFPIRIWSEAVARGLFTAIWGMKVTGLQDESRNSEIRMDVMAALSGMSDEFRTVIVLREMEGLSYAEIAGVLDVPQGTVESRLFRARAELKHLLKEYL